MIGLVRGGIGGFLALALVVASGNAAAEERYALVRARDDLYVAPRADAPRLNPYTDAEAARGQLVVHRLLEARDDGWLALETVPASEWDRHCTRGLRALGALRLRVFVPADAAVPVTTRPIRLDWPDGAAVALAPGVPLSARDGGRWWARLGPVGVELALPPDAVGRAYLPGETFGRPETGVAFADDSAVRAGALRLGDVRLGPASDLPVPLLFAREKRADGDYVVATFDLGCGRVTARVASSSLRATKEVAAAGVAGATAEAPRSLRVAPGATAYWPDGTPAGRVEAPAGFDREVASAHPPLRCLQRPLRRVRRGEGRLDPRSRLVLCFEPSAIVR